MVVSLEKVIKGLGKYSRVHYDFYLGTRYVTFLTEDELVQLKRAIEEVLEE